MRIGVIRQRYTPHGGAERVTQGLLEALLARGHEVHLFATRWETAGALPEGLIFHRVPRIPGPGFLRVLTFAWLAPQAADRWGCRTVLSLDRVLGHPVYRAGDGVHRAWLEARAGHLPPWRRVWLRLSPLHRSLLYLESRLLSPGGARLIVANSRRVRDEIQRYYGRPPEEIRVIHNGVDTERFHPGLQDIWRTRMRRELAVSREALVLLFVGSGFERKGLAVVIRAAGSLRKEGHPVHVVVVGKGRIRGYLKLVREYGMDNCFSYVGPQVHTERYYGCADLFVLPSLYEPFSNACLEALACGVPVVTSWQNGIAEVMAGRGCGHLVQDPRSVQELADALRLFADPARRVQAGRRAREVALGLSWRNQMARLVDLLEATAREERP